MCYTSREFTEINKTYDCLLFSHIVEHFSPEELKKFFEFYFKYLKDGGYIIIATPVLWKGFYWDFDHIKMYHPIGINMVFSGEKSQIQYYAKNKLTLIDLYFRRSPYMVHYKKGLYIKNRWSFLWNLFNRIYEVLFDYSFGYIGEVTGWIGVYRKNLFKAILKKHRITSYKKGEIGIWGIGGTARKILDELENFPEFNRNIIKGFFVGG